jgi:hypothetical protein
MADELNKPSRGTGDWDIPLNQNFDTLEAAARAFLPRGTTQTLNVADINSSGELTTQKVNSGEVEATGNISGSLSQLFSVGSNGTLSALAVKSTDGVSTSATEIFTNDDVRNEATGIGAQTRSHLIHVMGREPDAGADHFTDLLFYLPFSGTNVIASANRNVSETRVYSANSGKLELSMSGDTFDIIVQVLALNTAGP